MASDALSLPQGSAERTAGPRPADAETPPTAPWSLSALYERQSARLVAALRRAFGNGPPDPEDIAQQAFQKLIERPDHSDIRNIDAFLWRIARNLVLKERARDDVRTRYDFEVEQLFFPSRSYDSTPERVISATEQLKLINEVILAMPETRRRCFVLHRIQGLSISEVSRRMGFSRQAAMKHIARAAADIQEPFVGDPE